MANIERDAEAIRDAIKDAGYLGDRHAEAAARDAEAALDRLLATHRGAVEENERLRAALDAALDQFAADAPELAAEIRAMANLANRGQ